MDKRKVKQVKYVDITPRTQRDSNAQDTMINVLRWETSSTRITALQIGSIVNKNPSMRNRPAVTTENRPGHSGYNNVVAHAS